MLSVGDQIKLKSNHSELIKGWWDKTINTLRNDYGSIVDIECIETHLWNVVLEVGDTDPNYDYLVSYFDSECEHGMFIDYCEDIGGYKVPMDVFNALYALDIRRGNNIREGWTIGFAPQWKSFATHKDVQNSPLETVVDMMVMKIEDIVYLSENKDAVTNGPLEDDREYSPFFILGRSKWFNARDCLTPFCEVPNSELHYVIMTDRSGPMWVPPNLYKKIG